MVFASGIAGKATTNSGCYKTPPREIPFHDYARLPLGAICSPVIPLWGISSRGARSWGSRNPRDAVSWHNVQKSLET